VGARAAETAAAMAAELVTGRAADLAGKMATGVAAVTSLAREEGKVAGCKEAAAAGAAAGA